MTNRYTKLKEEKNSTRVARVKYVLVVSFKGTIGLYFVALCTRKKNTIRESQKSNGKPGKNQKTRSNLQQKWRTKKLKKQLKHEEV